MPASYQRKIVDALGRQDLARAESLAENYLKAGGGGDGLYLLGAVRAAQGRKDEAVTLMERAAALLPDRADIAYNLGVVLRESGRLEEAVGEWRRAVGLDEHRRDAWLNLAHGLDDLGDIGAAADAYGALLTRWPEDREGLYNFGNLFHRLAQFDSALSVYAHLLHHHPDFIEGWVNFGMSLKAAGRLDDAEGAYRRAIAFAPDQPLAHFNLGNLLALTGRWPEAFTELEWRLALADAPRPDWGLPFFNGDEPPGTRIALWNDQGFGDAILFLRYVPRLAERGYKVMAYWRDELVALTADAAGLTSVQGLSGPPPEADVHLPLASLPFALRLTDPATSFRAPYLARPPALLPEPPGTAGGPRIGIVWAGNPTHVNDAYRSARIEDFAPLIAATDARYYSLQVGNRAADLQNFSLNGRIVDMAPALADFDDTARVVAALDLVLSVDTAIVHLAGAMGKACWVLLPAHDSDWRWGLTGETTPWYPSLRLIRQATPKDWQSVLTGLAAEIGRLPRLGP